MNLEQSLKELGQKLEQASPERDSRQTDSCPPFSSLADWAHGKISPQISEEHIRDCAYCQKVIATVLRHSSVVVQPLISALPNHLTQELRAYAVLWFRSNQPTEDEEIAGIFDADGTLHLSLSNIAISGRVKVRLLADEMPLPLFETEITEDHWEGAVALPEWDLRNVRIASSCIELVATK